MWRTCPLARRVWFGVLLLVPVHGYARDCWVVRWHMRDSNACWDSDTEHFNTQRPRARTY